MKHRAGWVGVVLRSASALGHDDKSLNFAESKSEEACAGRLHRYEVRRGMKPSLRLYPQI